MDVFISWSGERSKYVAQVLREWIPNVLQAIKPWMSDLDIIAGQRWAREIGDRLEADSVGIICLTPENQGEPWVLFESGALSKSVKDSLLIPYLFDLAPSEVVGPLSQFQCSTADRDGTYRLVLALNKVLGSLALAEPQLKDSFDTWWNRLETTLATAPSIKGPDPVASTSLLDEIGEVIQALKNKGLLEAFDSLATELAAGKRKIGIYSEYVEFQRLGLVGIEQRQESHHNIDIPGSYFEIHDWYVLTPKAARVVARLASR